MTNNSGKNTTPRISIITVSYNAEKHIKKSIESVIAQDYPNIQYIIIDGGSTDKTTSVIKEFEDEIDHFVSEPDSGIYDAMNKGIALADGELMGFLNADDYYLENALNTVADTFIETNSPVICGKILKRRDFKGQSFFREEIPKPELMDETMAVFHPATFIGKSVFDSIGNYDTTYSLSADYDFLLRAWLKGFTFELTNSPLSVFRLGGESSLNCQTYKEGYAILRKHDLPSQQQMKKLIDKCKRKKFLNKIINTLAKVPGLRSIYEKQLIKKWNN